MSNEPVINPVEVLLGEQLSAVIFIQDYLQLDFDGRVLTCYRWPQVQLEEDKFDFGDDGYRDTLCSFIAKEVVFVDLEQEFLKLVFAGGMGLFLSLGYVPEDILEIATFRDADGSWSFF